MKPFTAIFFTTCLLSLRALVAQDAGAIPVPAPIPSDTQPQGTAPAPSASPAAPSLFPSDNPPPIVPKPPRNSGGDDSDHSAASKNPPVSTSHGGGSAVSIEDNIAYRKAKTKALHDEKVQQALADIDAARTDPDKRAALKRYYTLLAERILKIDGSIKKLVQSRLEASLKTLNENRVRPGDYPEEVSAGH